MSQFLELIEWLDATGTEIAHRVPEESSGETKFGAQLVVRDSQAAVFFQNGRGLDVFGPGRHTLSTSNLPILTKVLSLPWGFQSPFRCEIYFVNQKIFTQMRWGTKDPVAFKDRELGLIRLRAFGTFTMRVTQPLLFINSIVGTQASFETDAIEDYLREVIVSRLNDYLGDKLDSLLELPKRYDEMAGEVRERLVGDFRKYGIELVDLFVNRITPPEEVQRMIDERAGMAAVGNLDEFFKFRAAKAIADAASAGGGAGAGMGLGAGAGLGMLLPGMLLDHVGGAPASPREIVAKGSADCPACHGTVSTDSRFCPHCGHQLVVIRKCARCEKNLSASARYCSACGLDQQAANGCAKCGTRLPPGTRFCFHCGERAGE